MAENILAGLGSDSVVPDQYFDTCRRSEPLEPEKTLLLAILEDAIDSYQKYSAASDRVGRERFCEAEEWLMGGANDWIFSFENVCAMLGLDANYVRRGLRDWRQKEVNRASSPRHRGIRRHAA